MILMSVVSFCVNAVVFGRFALSIAMCLLGSWSLLGNLLSSVGRLVVSVSLVIHLSARARGDVHISKLVAISSLVFEAPSQFLVGCVVRVAEGESVFPAVEDDLVVSPVTSVGLWHL